VTLPRSALDDLPSSGTIGGLLETTIPQITSDRIEGGGLSVGSESRLGAGGSSWTQTAFYLDDLDFTDAGLFGASLLFLDPAMLDTVATTTSLWAIERSAPGLSVRLTPRRPSTIWEGRAEFFSTIFATPQSTRAVPPIATLHTWNRLAASASGPLLRDRLTARLGVAASNATRFERRDPTLLHSRDASGFANLLYTASPIDDVSVMAAGRSARIPLDGRLWIGQPAAQQRVSNLLLESRWLHRANRVSLSVAGGVWGFTAKPDAVTPSLAYIDSIRDMPIMDAVSASQSRHRWSAAVRASGTPNNSNQWLRHGRGGIEFAGGTVVAGSLLAPAVAETVEGFPARLWRFGGTRTEHHATNVSIYAAESIPVSSRITLDGGLRWEGMSAAADSGSSVGWSDWFPSLSVRWKIVPNDRLTGMLGLGRYGYRTPLEMLNYGDPAAPGGDVFRWNDANRNQRFDTGEEGPLVSHVGNRPAGTSEIDPALQRPHLNELLLGVEARPSPVWTLRLAGLTRRAHQLMAAVNSGVPERAYIVTAVQDPGGDLLDPSDDQHLPIFNRRPETLGADHYVLTNPGSYSTFQGVELSVRYSGSRLWILAGATAGRSWGPAAARGFQAFQNDEAITGDVLTNPNATTFARGALFSNRGYTIKASGTYRLPHDVRLGIVGRYQDGQPFSRLVLAQALNQGTEVIRAYEAGRTRFTYTLTADARVQIPLTFAKQRVDVVWDIFNFVNMTNEVEEFVLTGPAFRTPTAVQPRPVMHVGLRLVF
jgi:TonB-dependent receptor-like protein